MTFKTTRLRDAITFALAVGSIAGTGAAFAQAAPATTAPNELDRVTVTGSRIRQVDKESASPVLTIDRTQLEATGLTSVGDVLFNITASDGGALRNITTSTNGSDGTQNVSLRGLGATRTLVLVNGRRWLTDGNGTVDLNTIPLAVVERIEVLKDGASAIYGSDAIAGVINVITRKNFEGGEARAYLGAYSKGDGFQQSYDFTLGSNNDRVNTVFSLSYTDQTPVLAKDRTLSEVPVFGGGDLSSGGYFGSGSTLRGNFTRCAATPTVNLATGFRSCGAAGSALTLNEGSKGTSPGDFRKFVSYTTDGSGHSDRYNYSPVNYLLQPIQRFNIYGQGTLKLTDHVTANVQATYVKRRSEQQLAEVPLTMDIRGLQGPQYAFTPSKDSFFNPFKQDIRNFNFRAQAVGPRHNSYDVDALAVTTWLEGDFELFGRGMFWDAGYSYLDTKSNLQGANYVNLFNLKNAVGASRRNAVTGALQCLDAGGNVIAGCTPYNLFGGPDLGLAAGTITKAEYDAMNRYIRYTLVEAQEAKTKDYFANLSGDIFDLPAGPLGFAVGVEHRTNSYYDQPDALVAGGGSSTNFREPTSGNISSDEQYAELNIPVLADVPFFKLLELNLAARHSKYDSSGVFGPNQVNPDIGGDVSRKVGIKWKMFDQFLLRGTYSESFRAPSVSDLFSGGQESFPNALDPCAIGRFAGLSAASQAKCVADGVPQGGYAQPNTQIRALNGGNPNLKPEFGTTKSLGFVYSPTWLNNFEMTLDWYNIKLQDALAFRGAQTVLNNCYRSLDPFFCGFVKRDSSGNVFDLRGSSFNQTNGQVEGYDMQLKYRLPETAYGRFGFQFDSTYQTKNDLFGTVGEYNGSPTWRLRSNLTTTWQMGDFDATWAMRYYSGLDEDCSGYENLDDYGITVGKQELCNKTDPSKFAATRTAENHLGAVTYHDIQVGWKTPWNAKVSVGARNVFGKEPPRTLNSFAHSFDGAYDLPQGGFYYMQYNQKF